MRYIVERDLRSDELLVSAVRNNYRVKPGQAFLVDKFEKTLRDHFTGVGEVLKIGKRGKLSSLYRTLDGIAPYIANDLMKIDEAVDTISNAIINAIKAEAKRLKSEGVSYPNISLVIRQKILDRLR